MVFRDSILQIVRGWAKLRSHAVTGVIGLSLVFLNSSKEESAKAPTTTEVAKTKTRKPDASDEASQRQKRTTTTAVQIIEGRWKEGLTMYERCREMNNLFNK